MYIIVQNLLNNLTGFDTNLYVVQNGKIKSTSNEELLWKVYLLFWLSAGGGGYFAMLLSERKAWYCCTFYERYKYGTFHTHTHTHTPEIPVAFSNFIHSPKSIINLFYLDHPLLHNILTYSMVQSPSWAADWLAASQEIPRISRNPKVHYRTHKRPPPISILGHPNPVHYPNPTSWRSILILFMYNIPM